MRLPPPFSSPLPAVVAAAVLLAGCSSGGTRVELPAAGTDVVDSPLPAGEDLEVDRVVDGDTVVLDGRRFRLIGIDTPETVKPDAAVECYGPEAAAATKALLPPGTEVRVVRDVERTDRYDRELGYVFRRADGVFVSAYLLRYGFAKPLTVRPNTARRVQLSRLTADAQRERRGLWSRCR